MTIKEKLGNLNELDTAGRCVDSLPLAWYETGKRILHKQTVSGQQVVLKFLKEAQQLNQDDVLYADAKTIIAVDILPCEIIVIKPASMYQMARACYEIGNKHMPLFYEADSLLLPYDAPVFRMLQALGFNVEIQHGKLLHQLQTSVVAHEDRSRESLFSKILKLTTAPDAT